MSEEGFMMSEEGFAIIETWVLEDRDSDREARGSGSEVPRRGYDGF